MKLGKKSQPATSDDCQQLDPISFTWKKIPGKTQWNSSKPITNWSNRWWIGPFHHINMTSTIIFVVALCGLDFFQSKPTTCKQPNKNTCFFPISISIITFPTGGFSLTMGGSGGFLEFWDPLAASKVEINVVFQSSEVSSEVISRYPMEGGGVGWRWMGESSGRMTFSWRFHVGVSWILQGSFQIGAP